MKKWSVVFSVGASVAVDVEAETKEEAEQLAWETVSAPSLCYHCAGVLDVGEPYEIADIMEVEE
jgi:hypothetical protein